MLWVLLNPRVFPGCVATPLLPLGPRVAVRGHYFPGAPPEHHLRKFQGPKPERPRKRQTEQEHVILFEGIMQRCPAHHGSNHGAVLVCVEPPGHWERRFVSVAVTQARALKWEKRSRLDSSDLAGRVTEGSPDGHEGIKGAPQLPSPLKEHILPSTPQPLLPAGPDAHTVTARIQFA
ncbi:unnamed protein product [Lota lota]